MFEPSRLHTAPSGLQNDLTATRNAFVSVFCAAKVDVSSLSHYVFCKAKMRVAVGGV